VLNSMLCGIWENIKNFAKGVYALIPQFLYFIYTCAASLLDAMQFVIRKLAGLDVYYVNGVKTQGDIVYDVVIGILGINGVPEKYSSLATVFWSMVIFGGMLLVLSTIFAIIRSHYATDTSKANPFNIIRSAVKTLFMMAIIPLASVFGIYLANVLLQALDEITSPASNLQIEEVYKNSSRDYTSFFEKGNASNGAETYASYDFFTFGSYTNTATFSGIMFEICANNANRVRGNSYTASKASTKGTDDRWKEGKWSDFGIFTSTVDDEALRKEEVATMIDTAFAFNLRTKDPQIASLHGTESWELVSSFTYFQSGVWYLATINFRSFSKYNVGLVWYYYDLWSFNFFIAFAGMSVAITFLSSVVFGLIVRMIECLALFVIFPPLVGMGPMDGNKAIGKWKKQFIGDVLMGYGAVIGLNLIFLILNEIDKMTFFQSSLLNRLSQMAIILAMLAVLKDLVKLVSSFIGGGDANEIGGKTKGDVKKAATKAADVTLKAGKAALKVASVAFPAAKAAYAAIKKIEAVKNKIEAAKDKLQGGGRGKLKGNISKEQEEAKELSKQASDAFAISNKDEHDLQDIMEDQLGNEGNEDTKEKIKQFSDKHKSSNGMKNVDELYDDYLNKYNEGSLAIDKDEDLSEDEKKEEKAKLSRNLASEMVHTFGETNDYAIKSRGLFDQALEHSKKAKSLQKDLDDSYKGEAVLDAEGNVLKDSYGKKGTSPRRMMVKGALDFAGQTLKLVGNITGMSSAWKYLDKEGVVDSGKEVIQQYLQNKGLSNITAYAKSGRSKLSTHKQKEEKDAAEELNLSLRLQGMFNESVRLKNEVLSFVDAIKKSPNIKPIKTNAKRVRIRDTMRPRLYKELDKFIVENHIPNSTDEDKARIRKGKEAILNELVQYKMNDKKFVNIPVEKEAEFFNNSDYIPHVIKNHKTKFINNLS